MEKKIDTLRTHMRAGDWDAALKLAAGFPRLGEHRGAILSAKDAIVHPRFMVQLGKDPAVVRAAGIAALRARYPMGDAD